YNDSLATPATQVPNNFRYHQTLDMQTVYEAFFLHAVLLDAYNRHEPLELPHAGPQRDHLVAALDSRNKRMIGTGQEFWAHRCKKCMHLIQGPDGKIYAVDAGVMDGTTMGHTCCSVDASEVGICRIDLLTPKDRFCPQHSDRKDKCFVKECQLPPEKKDKRRTHKGMRELVSRYLRRPRDTHEDGDRVNVVESRPTIIGRLNRKWTHNEQLFVRPCGVIVSRCTFYHAEGLESCNDFLKVTFPTSQYPSCLPSYIFYDNNCQMLRHLWKQRDPYYNKTGMVVETWHAQSHKETDEFCRRWCLPSRFPELIMDDGKGGKKWRFNASAAEQANSWFGGYHPIVREMSRARYTFYLDEMIAMRNRAVVAKLEDQGQAPVLAPESVLRAPVQLIQPAA
ncbi:hypothetical protein ARMGADRAFT_945016, partial [Armillaria gallica]